MTQSLIKIDTSIPDIVILTMNRPEKRNALSIQLMREMIDAIHTHQNSCRALVLAAEGPVFSAGMDLNESADPKLSNDISQLIADLFTALYSAPCVTICAIQGDVLAGGVGLVLGADYALMAEWAHVSFPEVKKGIVPALVAVMLRRQIAMRHVRELLIFGQKIEASRACTMGVINQAVQKGSVLGAAVSLAKSIVHDTSAPESAAAVPKLKKLLLGMDPIPLHEEILMALQAHRERMYG